MRKTYKQMSATRITTLNQSPGAGPGANSRKKRIPEATQEREERITTLTEADPTVPVATLERRLVRLHIIGPRVPRHAVHDVTSEQHRTTT